MKKSTLSFAVLIVVLVCTMSSLSVAQTTASITGIITDVNGAIVVGAKITVKSAAQGTEKTTETNSSGVFEVAALPPGLYSVKVDMKGFQSQLVKQITLDVSRTLSQNFTLKVASTSEVVEVEATAPLIESTTMTVGQSIDQKTVQEIPLNGRHFMDLGLLIAGTVTPPQNGFLTAPLRGQGSFAINTAGNREDTVNLMVNGINLNDMVQNQVTFQPSINTVSEFKVDNSTYSAEYGRNSGAIVNIATRSGSNSFHGEVFEFFRNNALDARNFFNPKSQPMAQLQRNQFGGSIGGPIFKDKTFFFASYEGLRQKQGLTLNTTVLTAAQRAGVTNAVSQQLLQFIPSANDSTGSQFLGSATAPVNIDQGTMDIQHNISDKTRLHAYYAGQHDLRQEPILQGNTVPSFGDTRESKRQIFTLGVDRTFGSNMVNEVRLGFNRIHITFSPNNLANPVTLGIQNGKNFNAGLPQTSITGTGINFGGPSGFPQGRGDTTAVLADTLSYLRGRHSFKFGGEFRRFFNNNFASDTGTLNFTSVANFQTGTLNTFTLNQGNNPSRIRTGELGFFVMDNWKATNKLTLELGLRYDWNQTPTEAVNRFVNFVVTAPGVGSLVSTPSPYAQNNKNFQPRLGFAYDVFGSGKTVLRAGYAVMTDQPITNLVTGLTNNPPLGSPVSCTSGCTYSNLLVPSVSALAPTVVDPKFKNSYVQSYNLNVQHQLTNRWSVTAGYYGNKGTHLRTRVNLNQFVAGVRPFPTTTYPGLVGPPVNLGNISENVSNGNSTYNALWLTSNMASWHGLQFNASFTYSKSLDWTSQNGQGIVIENSLNPRADKGLSDFNARQRFSMNFIYSMPFKGNRLVEGWQVGSIIQDQTGNPVNILANASGLANFTGVSSIRPDLVGPIQLVKTINSNGTIQWFANSVCDPFVAACSGQTFSIPDVAGGASRAFHFGNFGRNVIIGPGFNNVDFSLLKKTKITERFTNELRIEIFDLFNHPNFGQPGGGSASQRTASVGSATFGQISNTRFATGDSGSSRQLQFALKLVF